MSSKWIGAGLLAAAFASPALGQAPAALTPASPAPASPARGEALYLARCKDCHESGDERALSRAQLAAKTPAEIVTALTTGPMAAAADGLSPEDKLAIATYLTAR